MIINIMNIIHIYNGHIKEYPEIQLIEFKLVSIDGQHSIFKKNNYHCCWFIQTTILNPILIDINKIKDGKRIIQDQDYPELNECEIIVDKNNLMNNVDCNIQSYIFDNYVIMYPNDDINSKFKYIC